MSITQGLAKAILYVQDMNTQARFYRDKLNLTVKDPVGVEDYNNVIWVEFETGECSLVLHLDKEKQLGKDRPKLVFSVNDIDAAHTALTERGVKLSDIRSRIPGLKVADGFDLEGNPFSIYHEEGVTKKN